MIDPRTVMVAVPCHDGRMMAELTGALISCTGLYHGFSAPTECSHPSLVRNMIAAQFMASHYEWLVCIDNDIAFYRRDMETLLQPYDTDAEYILDDDNNVTEGVTSHIPQPTRCQVTLTVDGQNDYSVKTVGMADVLVAAEYARRNESGEAIKLGMGFVRIHRSVFETLKTLKHEDGSARLWQASYQGRMYYDFYPSGPLISSFVPTGDWKGEDHGFFTLCMLCGIVPRIETRTRLVHIGRKAYLYTGPDMGGEGQ